MSFGLPLRNGVSIGATSTVALGSWARTSVNDFRVGMPAGSTYTRSSIANGLSAPSVVQSFAVNEPQRTVRGLALEPARTNLLIRSSEFDNAAWTKDAGGTGVAPVVTANAGVAPDGTATADRIEFNRGAGTTVSDFSRIFQFGAAGAEVRAAAIWIKSNDGTTYSLQLVSASNVLPFTIGPAWTRVTIAAASSTNLILRLVGSYGAETTADVLVWAATLEAGGYASSEILTTTATATRSLPVFTETVPASRTKALLTYADASTTLVTGLTPGGTFDTTTEVIGANKGRVGVSELVTRLWYP